MCQVGACSMVHAKRQLCHCEYVRYKPSCRVAAGAVSAGTDRLSVRGLAGLLWRSSGVVPWARSGMSPCWPRGKEAAGRNESWH